MNPTLRDLPLQQRVQLVEDLWDSIAQDQQALPVTDAQRAELDRRLDAYEQDGNQGRDATTVLNEIRQKL
ncbi:addiction module protein [Rheinheimera maricola]|uniref:Addiction module protein n=1 Tax=Rheinheimera maricola TaxID=2793282 RepID=A0ABS7X9E3_9GAMM|nr:addiction module protein [Rheinheimera maricola]MBU1555917.1 addiction module protein [Gammaproteobacteria bacterium]MBU2069163.1 addiction module protein [Gammaproteobacteria bacterium]MBU2184180.1 addiction module protein [Gammaproteobacteria bacterium]MBU2204970.1 addiction module protein [Gammaproteobacteria bacterium]MBZ9611804.1 addiction module protein [Rheinheimera maricola]